MTAVALGELRAHPGRLLATAVSVVLGVAFVAGTFVFSDTRRAATDELLGDLGAGADLVVRPRTGSGAPGGGLPAEVADAVAAADGVAAVAPVYEGPTRLLGPDGAPLEPAARGFGAPPSATGWIAEDALRDAALRQGRAPTAPDEVAVGAATARALGLGVGDRVRVVFGNGVRDATVVGTFGYGPPGAATEPLGAPTVAVAPALAAEQLGAPRALRLRVASGREGDRVKDAVEAAVAGLPGGAGLEVVDGATAARDQREEAGAFFVFLTTGLLVFAGVSLLVAAATIATTFTIVVAQRTRQYALLRAVGASRRQVTGTVLVEAGVVGLVGSAAGLLVGLGLAVGLEQVLGAAGLALPAGVDGAGGLVVRARTVLVAVGLGVTVTVLAALVPAARANRVAPVEALRGAAPGSGPTGGGGLRRVRRARLVGAVSALAGGTAVLAAGLFRGDGTEATAAEGLPLVGAGGAGVLLGAALLGPWFVGPVASAIAAPIAALRGAPGELARLNAVRNPSRTAAVASALMIGVGLASLLLVLAASLQAAVEADLERQFVADFQVDPANFPGFPEAASRALAQVPGVATVSAVRYATLEVAGTPQVTAGVQPSFADRAGLAPVDGDLGALDGTDSADGTGIALTADLAARLGLAVTDRVPVVLPDGTRADGRVVATYDSGDSPFGDNVPVLTSYARLAAALPGQGDNTTYVWLEDGATVEQVRPRLAAVLADFPTAGLVDADEARARTQGGADQALGLVLGLLVLSFVIAVFGIVTALGLSVVERTRELGLLRAVGMTRRQVRTMVRWESVVTAVLGGVLGLAVGLLFGWLTVSALPGEFGTLAVPVGRLALTVAVTALAGVVAAAVPARRAARIDVLDALAVQ